MGDIFGDYTIPLRHDPWLPPVRIPAATLEWNPSFRPIPGELLGLPLPGPPPPPQATIWRPNGLGVGLVYDWRFSSGSFSATPEFQSKDLKATLKTLEPEGYHPVHLHAYIADDKTANLAGVWLRDDDSSYETKVFEGLKKDPAISAINDLQGQDVGWRAIGVTSVHIEQVLRFSLVFIRDRQKSNAQWGVVLGRSISEALADIVSFKSLNRRIISLSISAEQTFLPLHVSYVWIASSGDDMIGPEQWKVDNINLPKKGADIVESIKGNISAGWSPTCMDSTAGALWILYVNDQTGLQSSDWHIVGGSSFSGFHHLHSISKATHPTRQLVAFATHSESPSPDLKCIAIWRNPLKRFTTLKSGASKLGLEDTLKLDFTMMNVMEKTDIPCGVIAVTKGKEIVFERAITIGPKGLSLTEPSSRFRVGSVSKPITALGVLKALYNKIRNDGISEEVSGLYLTKYLDSPIFSWPDMPSVVDHPFSDKIKGISIRQVLQHLSGWSDFLRIDGAHTAANNKVLAQLGFSAPFPMLTREQMFTYLLNSNFWKVKNAFISTGYQALDDKTIGVYSNVGYSILERLVEVVSGVPYDDFVTNEILIPVGAFSTFLDKDARFLSRSQSVLHSSENAYLGDTFGIDTIGAATTGPSYLGKGAPSSSAPVFPYGSRMLIQLYSGAAAWASTASDLARIASAFSTFRYNNSSSAGMTDLDGNTILPHSAVSAMWKTPTVEVIGLPYRLGWWSFAEDNSLPNGPKLPSLRNEHTDEDPSVMLSDRSFTQVRWHQGDFYGTHAGFAWRSDDKCFAYIFSRDRQSSSSGNIFTLINNIVKDM